VGEAKVRVRLSPFDLYRAWWRDAPTRLGSTTVRLYRRQVWNVLADTCWDPLEVSPSKVRAHLDTLKPQWAGEVRKGLNDFFSFLERRGFIRTNPLEEVKVKVPMKKRVKRGLSEEELVRLLVAAVYVGMGHRRFSGERLAFQILAQYALGLRPGEMVALTSDRIELNGAASHVVVTETKTGVDRVVPIGNLAREAISYLLTETPNRLVEVGRTQHWYRVRRAARAAELAPEKCRPYAARHSFATRLIERGVHSAIVAELMGHSDLRQILRYSSAGTDERLRSAVELLG
jgi:integrase/recombinase XerD